MGQAVKVKIQNLCGCDADPVWQDAKMLLLLLLRLLLRLEGVHCELSDDDVRACRLLDAVHPVLVLPPQRVR